LEIAETHFMRKLTALIQNGFRSLGYFLWDAYMFFEFLLLIAPIEFLMRLWYRLDPALYFRSKRIRSITEGKKEKADDVFYIFALYTKTEIPKFTRNFLDAINRAGHNLIIVSHANLTDKIREELLSHCYLLIERKGIGRDFGAYKDGIHTLLEKHPDPKRIVLSNDSCFFMERLLDRLIRDLNGPHEFIGVTEVFQYHYHVQSFLVSFGRNAIQSAAFEKFWRKYKPITTRRWSIHQGELKLTRRITAAGFRPHILYQAAELSSRLNDSTVKLAMESVRLMPVPFRRSLFESFSGYTDGKTGASALEAVSYGVARNPRYPSRYNDTPNADPIASIGEIANTLEGWSAGVFVDELIKLIAKTNQMHTAGFLFIKYLGMPMFKRDIFYREIYSLEDVYRFLTSIEESMRDEIMSDLRRTGSGALHKGLYKILYRHGSI
jgi:hypothetical protein